MDIRALLEKYLLRRRQFRTYGGYPGNDRDVRLHRRRRWLWQRKEEVDKR